MTMGRYGSKVCATWSTNSGRGSGTANGRTLVMRGSDSFASEGETTFHVSADGKSF